MTNERIIQVIAEADGWTSVSETRGFPPRYMIDRYLTTLPKEEAAQISAVDYCCFPDYLTSYDAIIPVVVKWCEVDNERWKIFELKLSKVMFNRHDIHFGIKGAFKATQEQLSIALVKAMGKWEE